MTSSLGASGGFGAGSEGPPAGAPSSVMSFFETQFVAPPSVSRTRTCAPLTASTSPAPFGVCTVSPTVTIFLLFWTIDM